MTISQAQIDQLHTSAASALNSLNIAYGAQALAETLPLIGTGLGTSSSDATQVMENTRTALVNALSTLSGAATYTAAQVEIEINNALASIGMSGVVVGVQVSGSDITLSINAEAGETSQFAVAGDIGLPGIAVSVAGSADVAANAALSLTMGLDSSGFFIDTAASGIDLSLGTTGVTFNASASLGVLQYVVADAGTELDLEFAIDLTDANNDGLLRLSEMGQDFLDVSLNGQADIGLAMAADFGTGALPSVSAVLEIDWQFINADVNPTDQNVTFGELPSVVLKDVTLDLGSFLENVMLPIFDAIAPLIDPINTALEVITADITMLKLLPNWETLLDLSGDGEINMLDLLKLADPDIDLGPIEDFIDLAKDIVDWAEFLDSVAVGEAGLNFGDFNLDTAEDLRDLAFDITTANLDLQGAADTLTDVVDALSGGEWTNSSGGTSPQEMLQEMVSGTAFSVPILEDPAQILSLLFGGEADLVEIDFPEVSMSAGGDSLLTIPVFTGITVNIGGSISAAFDLAFGYSTRGLTMPGASALTALNGLYVIDGEGPEASLSATINLGAALDAVIASLYGGGAVTGTIELDIADGLQSQPGRLYYDEFLAALSTNPFSLFDASGSITAHLTLAARVLGGDIFRIDSPQITLADFNFTGVSGLASSTSTLALASLSGGVLTLNTGPLAGNRLVGSAVDGNEIAYVSDATGGKVNVVIDGYAEAYTSGTQIAADLGQGNDQLVLSETLAIAGSIEGGEGRDILAGGAAGDTLDGGIGEDTLFGRDGNDSLIGGDGADLFYGGAGADTLSGGDGEDMVSYVYSGVGVNVNLGTGTGAGGTAQGDVLTSIEVLQGSNDADTLTGSGNGEMIIGLDGDDSIAGAGGDDVLLGSDGNDTLDGGTGADTMVGAQGDDLYFVDDTGDVVDENRYGEIPVGTDGGTDEVRAAISWSIATGTQSQIENLTLIGTAISGTGNAGDNVITANQLGLSGGSLYGGGGSDTLHGSGAGEWLDGQAGADSMIGHGGNDTYFVDHLGDDIVEAALEGTDTAISRLQSFALDADDDIEVMALDASVLNGSLTGNALDQSLIGASGNDTLEGLGGADALIGGTGRDRATYRSSTVAVSIDLTLAAQIGGDAAGDTYTSIEEIEGSALADTLIGDDGDNAFLGLGGDDTLRGALGNDTLLGGSGHDSLDGGIGADYLDGDAGNDSLDGGQDADTLIGGNGDDTYVVDHILEQVTELGTGTDLVQAWVDWSLDAPSQLNIENLTLLGAARIGTGNALANTLIGTAGNDRLDGLLGRDTMIGGVGDDTYVVDNVLDLITDTSGHDLIEVRAAGASSFDMSVQAADIEDLTVADTSGAVRITGNDLDNVITGNASGDTISGGMGNDTIIAGGGGSEVLSGDEGDDDLRLTLLSRGTHYVYGGEGAADIMRMDWSTSASAITHFSNSSASYYRTYVDGYVYTYFDGIESFDLRGGSASDVLYGGNLADTLVGNGGSDRLYGYRGALEVSGGAGHDLVYATIRTAEDVDLGLDFSLRLLDTQTGPVIVNAGTAVETSWEGIEQVRITTGAGNDLLDTRNVSSSSNVFGVSNYWNSGDGDDHYLTDLGALGSANFLAGDGIDTLTIDWGDATSGITYYSNSSATYYRVYVEGFGYVYQYFSDIEKIDFTTGSASDIVYAVGGRDRFVTNGGQDRIFGADKGDTVLAGDGNDWVSLDLRFGDGETDPAEDIDVTLSALQDEAAVFYEGTEGETHLQGVEQMYLYTGAGNDRFDTRGVASNSGWFGYSNYISLGDGDDHYLTDLGALGSANFLAGDGIDTLTIDWGDATSGITYYSNSSTTYYRVYVDDFGYVYQYFSDIEKIDFTTGSASDMVYAVGGRDRFVTNGGQDRIFGADKGDTVLAGDGNDWVSLDLRFGDGETDPAEDIDVTLSALQDEAAVFYEGTEDETHLQGVEQMYLYTGAGDDRFDTRGVASNSGWFGYSNYISLGDGDDHYLTDLGALGSANFLAGDGFDTLTIDWGAATSGITYYSNSSATYYRVYVEGFGYVYQYFSDIEKIDFTTGSASDIVYAVGGRDRFVTNGGQDRIFGADKGDTVLAGDGNDWVSLDLRFGDGETDPAEDIDVTLSALQDEAAVFYEGTEDETHLQGVEQMYLYTGAGNDRFDTRGVASNSGWFGYSNYISLGDGDDHYLTDLGALGSANFLAGDGIDTLTIDWGDATSGITYYSNSSTTYYRVYVDDFGYVYQYFSDIEKIDFTTGSASDIVYAVGGRDRFVTNGGQDRIFGADKGDTVLAGDGNDWVSLDLRFGDGETDPAEDIDVTLSALQDEAAVFYEGTEDETHLQGVEQMYLYTGAGDDRFDTRGVASNSGWFGYSNYISLGDGDDHYLTDLGALGSANFLAGDGFDTLTIDWGAATSGITYYSNSSTTYYRVYVEGFGYVYQYFSNVEIFDLTGGSGADSLLGGSLTDRLIGNAGNDTLRAGSGNDFVQGGAGHDLIVLGDGDDTAFGEAGNDTIIGSLGSDVNVAAYSGSAASIYVIDLGEGSYRVITEAGGSDLLQNIQTLRFTDGLVTTDYAISSLVNSAPVLPATAEATLVTGQTTPIFDAEATDPESHPVTYSLAGADAGLFAIDPLTGEVTFDGDPTLALPEAAVGGLVYSLEIIASDGYASGSQELTVTGVSNLPPEAVDDLATTNQSAPVSVDVLANDFDLEGPAPTLAGFGQPEHGSVTQAGGSLVYQPDAGFYGVDQFVYDIVDAQGLRSSGEVVINVNRVRERLDSEELASWQSQTTVISPTGQLISKEITYDDGRVLVAQYTNGVRSSQTLTDPENAHSWTSQSLAYDGGGALISMDTTFDDGRVLSAQYTNGVRSAQTLTDPENAFSWTDQIYAYDSDGTLISRVANYDDGRVLVSEYTAGVRSAQTLTDPQNAHSWTSQSSAYGVDGVLMSRVTNHDDGRVQSATYTAGVRSTQTLTDPDNAHRWTDQSLTYDSEGNLISKVTNFDDGRVGNFRYVAGVQAEATITDAADAFVWASIERDYNSSGVLIESQTTYDDGRILTTEFAAGVRSTQTQTDPDNVYLWTNKTDVFDVDGTLISRVTNFDDGTVQTWPVVDDSPA